MQTKKILLLTVILAIIFSNVYAGKISGLVNDGKDQPVINVNVVVYGISAVSSDTLFDSIKSDENGHFAFSNLENGTYYIDAHTFLETRPIKNIWCTMAGPFEVNQNSDIQDVVLKFQYILTEMGDLDGYVKTEAGKPLEGVQVEAFSDDNVNSGVAANQSFSYFTSTNEEGYYSFNNIMSGKYHVSCLHPIGGDKQIDELITVSTNQKVRADDIVYSANEIVEGYITGSVMFGNESTPVVGASVEFITIDPDTSFTFYRNSKVETDIDGNYSLSVRPGEYIVMCRYSDAQVPFFARYYDNTQDINTAKLIKVGKEQTVSDIDFSVPEPQILSKVTISGKVTDEQGSAISAATVELVFQSTFFSSGLDSLNNSVTVTTDANGDYSFTLKDVKCPSTAIVLSAVSAGYLREFYNEQAEYYLAETLVPGEQSVFENINFSLTKIPGASSYTISGAVNSKDGAAIEGAVVTAYHTNDVNIVSALTDSDGKYELDNLYEGKYIVQFYAPDYVPEFYDDVETWEKADMLSPDQPVVNINASLEPFGADSSSGKIMGSVMSNDGSKLGGVLITVKNSEGKMVGFDFTDSHGQYWIEGLKDGPLTLAANRVQYNSVSNVISISKTSNMYNLLLQKADDITSIVDDHSGSTIANSFVLQGNYPNPFNPSTMIRFALKQPAQVTVSVYNTIGQEIVQIKTNSVVMGNQSITWNGVNKHGENVQSGVYFYRIVATFNNGVQEAQTGRMLLLK